VAFVALLDANVLHPIGLCDVLLRLAEKGLFQPRWTEEILNEALRSIVRRHTRVRPEAIAERFDDMRMAFPEAMVTGYETMRDALANEMKDDAHVLAAAVVGGADLIVTNNVKDFHATLLRKHAVEAVPADTFLVDQWSLDPTLAKQVLAEMSADYDRPIAELVAGLERLAPAFVAAVRESGT
jgi:hypothetical protein